MPDNTQWWLNPTLNGTNRAFSNSLNIPAYERVSSIPSWLPAFDTNELANEYKNTGKMFDTSAYDAESEGQQSRLLTTALNAGNNAATEYANRARQSGGSGMGAGLIKAQASVGARKSAGEMALETKKFDASQREKAAGHAAQIASTLGSLRDSYLKTMVDYATKEDSTMADYTAKMAALDPYGMNNKGGANWAFTTPTPMGLASGLRATAQNNVTGQLKAAPSTWFPGNSWDASGRG